jgi:hypothetical protein
MPLTPGRLVPIVSITLVLALAGAAVPAAAAPGGAQHEGVRRGATEFAEHEEADIAKLSRVLLQLVQDRTLVEPFLAGDRARLLAAAQPTFEILKREEQITHWYFIGVDRKCFLRVHAPDKHGDVIARETLTQAIARRDVGAGMELGKTAFALRVVRPIRRDGEVVGYMELGEEIDHFFERMKAVLGDDFGLLADKEHVDRRELARVRNDDRWDERPDVVLINSTMWDEKRIQVGVPLAKLPPEGNLLGEWQDGGRRYVGGAFPVKDAAGHVVAALFVRHRLDATAGHDREAPAATAPAR